MEPTEYRCERTAQGWAVCLFRAETGIKVGEVCICRSQDMAERIAVCLNKLGAWSTEYIEGYEWQVIQY